MGESESPTVTASGKTKACDAASGAASTFQWLLYSTLWGLFKIGASTSHILGYQHFEAHCGFSYPNSVASEPKEPLALLLPWSPGGFYLFIFLKKTNTIN